MNRTYSELIQIPTFEERFEYLKVPGRVGKPTFGPQRYLNQRFYTSKEWKEFRDYIIIRDNGCDLALKGHDIFDRILIHHLNPISPDELIQKPMKAMNPETVVCVSHNTHEAIHFSDKTLLAKRELITRKPFDTCPWKGGTLC